jgi:hypothetical protein
MYRGEAAFWDPTEQAKYIYQTSPVSFIPPWHHSRFGQPLGNLEAADVSAICRIADFTALRAGEFITFHARLYDTWPTVAPTLPGSSGVGWLKSTAAYGNISKVCIGLARPC